MAVRRKKKSVAWKGFVAGMGLAGIFVLLFFWAVAGPSGLKLREAFRARMSVMADRADQFVEAWNRRSLPDKPGPKSAASVPEPKPARTSDRPVKPRPAPVGPAPKSPAVPGVPAPAPAPPPEKDVSPDDQRQLRELMRQLNQGG